jgi:hypothetical protein
MGQQTTGECESTLLGTTALEVLEESSVGRIMG